MTFREKLDPSLARVLMGDHYESDKSYELLTTPDGFKLAVTDPTSGEVTVTTLDAEPPRKEVISDVWESAYSNTKKEIDCSKLLLYFITALSIGVFVWHLSRIV